MIEVKNASFRYESDVTVGGIKNISLSVPDGQIVVLCGESGCGKTTLTRLINGLIPHYFEGELSGSVTIDGYNVSEQPLYDTAKLVGSVFQNPRSQFFNVDTTSELSFGCENLGMPKDEILQRLHTKNRDGLLHGHPGCRRTPGDIFFDSISTGEALMTKVQRNYNYYEVFTPEMMQSYFVPRAADFFLGGKGYEKNN